MERGGRDADEFGERTIRRGVTEKTDMRAQIGVPAMAPLAVHAGPRGIDGDECAGCEAGLFGEFRRDDPGELVTEHVRNHFRPSCGAAFQIGMQIAAAHSHGLHFNSDHNSPWSRHHSSWPGHNS